MERLGTGSTAKVGSQLWGAVERVSSLVAMWALGVGYFSARKQVAKSVRFGVEHLAVAAQIAAGNVGVGARAAAPVVVAGIGVGRWRS